MRPVRPVPRVWVYAGLGADLCLLAAAISMGASAGSSHRRAGGAYAWSQTLLTLAGVSLSLVALGGLGGSLRIIMGKPSGTLATTRKVFLAQVITVAVLSLLEVRCLILVFSFNGRHSSSTDSSEIDVDFPMFSNFAHCSWNACCRRTHVRERSYEKPHARPGRQGSAKTVALARLCANIAHSSSNASKCVMGDGLVEWRHDLSSWIFREIMSWSWIVFTIVVLEGGSRRVLVSVGGLTASGIYCW